jgi:hypothetical protein
MKKILTVHFKFFRSEEHYEYMIVFRDLVLKFPAVQALIATFYNSFISLIKKEEELINRMRKSDYTMRIAKANQRIDRALVGMRAMIIALLHHFDLDTANAAQSLLNRFDAFGYIIRKSYEEEIADVNILVEDLKSDEYAGKVSTVGLTQWVAELNAAVSDFEQLLTLRNTEYAQKPQGRLKNLRRETDVVYHRIVERISAAVIMENTPAYDNFIAEVNARITYFNRHSHYHARKDIGVAGRCIIESIATQPYTGKAVTPLPVVCYRTEGKPDTVLVFARDFTVTYRNNVHAGTAQLILHGKGAYRGSKMTTFNINGIF